jgi:hypothetical protein
MSSTDLDRHDDGHADDQGELELDVAAGAGRRLPFGCPSCSRTFVGEGIRDAHVRAYHVEGRSPCAHREDPARHAPSESVSFTDGYAVPGDVRREAVRLWREGRSVADVAAELTLTTLVAAFLLAPFTRNRVEVEARARYVRARAMALAKEATA